MANNSYKLKEIIFRLKYLTSKAFKFLIRSWRMLYLIAPIFFFLVLLYPPLFNKYPIWYDIPRGLPHIFTLHGKVVCKSNNIGLKNAKIEIGGFNAITNNDGKFSLKFISKNTKDIPIIITTNKGAKIYQLSFNNTNNITHTFFEK